MSKDLTARLEPFLRDALKEPVRIRSVRQLPGGASRITWNVTIQTLKGQQSLILRMDGGGVIQDAALSREEEYNLLQFVHAAGIKVAQPRLLCTKPEVLGAPFFTVDVVEGESVGRRVVKEASLTEARKLLPRQMGEQLAKIHALDFTHPGLAFLQRHEELNPARSALANGQRQLERSKEPHPVLEIAYRWLWEKTPECPRRVLCHGDYRLGNLMVGPDGLRVIFDWEFSHIGDPAEDLAWPTVRSWRFGNDQLRLGGIASFDEFSNAYVAAGGEPVSPERIAYWEILGNFRWAVGCIAQAGRHLSGQTNDVELAVLGRRTGEMELELLNLIDKAEKHAGSTAQ